LAIISVNERAGYSGYRKTQFRYATTYIIITLIVLVILNIYCSITCQKLFYQSKRESMIEKCLLISDEIATLDVLNSTSIATVIGQMESLKVTRLIVTDQSAKVLYDSANEAMGSYTLFPEILTAIDGNDVCSWKYRDGATDARAAAPIVYYGTIVGSVYMTEYETAQGAMIQSLQKTILRITLLLEFIVIIFSVAFANTFSRRLNKIMTSMRSSRREITPIKSTWAEMMN
jgi:sensor histidine kinase regulating citrate/malate metabolism